MKNYKDNKGGLTAMVMMLIAASFLIIGCGVATTAQVKPKKNAKASPAGDFSFDLRTEDYSLLSDTKNISWVDNYDDGTRTYAFNHDTIFVTVHGIIGVKAHDFWN